jgi:putative hemolysin
MIELWLFIALLACILASAFFSGSETAVISVNRFRLRGLHEQGNLEAGRILRLLGRTQRLLIMVLIGNNLVNVLAALLFKSLMQRGLLGEDFKVLGLISLSEALSLFLLTPIIIVLAEVLPKAVFRAHADRLIAPLRPFLHGGMILLMPAIWLIEWIARLMLGSLTEVRSRAVRRFTRQDLINLINPEENEEEEGEDRDAGEAGLPATEPVSRGLIPEQGDERRMVENIIRLSDTTAEEIMTPLVNLVALPITRLEFETLRQLAISSGYSRIPVYRDRIVHMIGFIDVFRVLRECDGSRRLEEFIERPHYVPESKRVDDLLQEFLDLRIKNAIVVDEYGGCSGWISREDIIEEIVGELEDELDEPEELLAEQCEGEYLADGRLEIDALNKALGASFSDEGWETLGGLLLAEMGRIPRAGDEVTIDGWRARVLSMDHQRIDKVRLSRLD